MGGCLSVLCPKNPSATVRKEDSDRQKLNGQVSGASARGTGTDGGGQQNPGFVPDADKERVNEGTGFMRITRYENKYQSDPRGKENHAAKNCTLKLTGLIR